MKNAFYAFCFIAVAILQGFVLKCNTNYKNTNKTCIKINFDLLAIICYVKNLSIF